MNTKMKASAKIERIKLRTHAAVPDFKREYSKARKAYPYVSVEWHTLKILPKNKELVVLQGQVAIIGWDRKLQKNYETKPKFTLAYDLYLPALNDKTFIQKSFRKNVALVLEYYSIEDETYSAEETKAHLMVNSAGDFMHLTIKAPGVTGVLLTSNEKRER